MAATLKKRKVDKECREFNEKWEYKYMFVEHFNKPICLICMEIMSVNKEYNIKRHYESKHQNYMHITGEIRKEKINKLKSNLKQQSSMFARKNTENENNTIASYQVARLIAEDMKPFVDGEFVKKCMLAVVDVVCPEKAQLFRNISLSARTVTRRICEISNDVKRQQVEKLNSLRYYSIAIDESTDVTDTAQLAVFIRGVNDNFEIFDSFVRLVPLKDTTTGADILAALLQCIEQMHLDLTNLVSVTTDGAPSMTGRNRGVVALLQKHMNDVGVMNILIKIHCIIHQEALCAKVLHIKTVMDVVVKAVNIILSRGLNH